MHPLVRCDFLRRGQLDHNLNEDGLGVRKRRRV
jgi:hypothetical protein